MRTQSLAHQQSWVFVLDGYDEIHADYNLLIRCGVEKWGIQSNTYIIGCRTEYLEVLKQKGKAKQALFALKDQPAEELSIAPFSTDQIDKYIETFADSNYNRHQAQGWDSRRYQAEMRKFPQLRDAISTPFLLVVFLQTFPDLFDKAHTTLTEGEIYQAFIAAWMEREMGKPQSKVTGEALRDFCGALAFEMWVKDTMDIDKEDEAISLLLEKNTEVFQSAPLQEAGEGRYQFIHPIYRDFFATPFILQCIANIPISEVQEAPIHDEPSFKDQPHHTKERQLNQLLSSSLTEEKIRLVKEKFNTKLLHDQLRGFLGFYAKQDPSNVKLIKVLWHYIAQGERSQQLAIAASNSLPILFYAGEKDFSKRNLLHLDLRNANLQGINFTAAQLPQDLATTDLKDANLTQTDLRKVKLPKDLSGVNFTAAQLPQDLATTDLKDANLTQTDLRKVKLPKDLSGVNFTAAQLPQDLATTDLKDANLTQTDLRKVRLPQDLAGANLTHAQLAGKTFTSTHFDCANLDNVILTHTTCDYQQCFQDHVEAGKLKDGNKLKDGKWYLKRLPKDLKSIAQVYPHLSQDSHKAEVLQIASGLAYLPYWEGTEFKIKVAYFSCQLLLLQEKLDTALGKQLTCCIDEEIKYDADYYCWQTEYRDDQAEEATTAPHADFDTYINVFQAGLKQYRVQSRYSRGFDYYKEQIEYNIQGLQKAYPKLSHPALQKEARDIACALSKSWQIQHLLFLFHYLSLQNRLIRLGMTAGVGVKNDLHYNPISC